MDKAISNYVDIELQFGCKRDEFKSLATTEKRFIYAYKNLNIFSFDNFKDNNGKNLQKGLMLKEEGNKLFSLGDVKRALKLYSESVITLPHRNEDEKRAFSITLANRSAALYHIGEYRLALVDIDLATDYGYPRSMNYKIIERKARCLLALKKFQGAQQQFYKAIQSVSESELTNKKRKEILYSIHEELNKLNKMRNVNDENERPVNVPVVASGKHPQYKAISSAVEIIHTDKSQYAVASRNINPGEILIIEEPHSAVVMPEFRKSLCFNCLKKPIAPQPCPDCCEIVFCSVRCQEEALLTHHKYECCILGTLWKASMHKWFLAMRTITQRGLQYFLHLRPTLKESWKTVHSKTYLSDDYRTLYSLGTKGNTVDIREFIKMAIYAVCYVKLLQEAKFFTASDTISKETLSDEETYIGGLILHNILVTGFNESVIQYAVNSKQVIVGTAVFPTNVCFKHSCIPPVYGYYNGSVLIAQSMFALRKGDIIRMNFNLIMSQNYYREPALLGDSAISSKYLWLKDLCKCGPCLEDWPPYVKMFHSLATDIWYRCVCGHVASGFPSSIMRCSKCARQLNTRESQVLCQVLERFCEKVEYLESSNMHEAVKTSFQALSMLGNQPVQLLVYYNCFSTAARCLDHFGNFTTDIELFKL